MSRWAMAGAWVLVAGLATALTWQIVSAADARVSERPPLQVAAPLPGPSTSSTIPSTSSSTTADPGSTTSTSATTPTVSTGTTTVSDWSSEVIPTEGGTVVIRYRPGEVVLSSASPASGFAAEIKKQGPPEVDVEFESESAKYRVRAKWTSDGPAIETEADPD